MSHSSLFTAVSLGLFAGVTASAALAETSPLEQQLKDLDSFQVIAHRGASVRSRKQHGRTRAGP